MSIPRGSRVAQMKLVAKADLAAEMVATTQGVSMEVPEEECHQLWVMTNKSGDQLSQSDNRHDRSPLPFAGQNLKGFWMTC